MLAATTVTGGAAQGCPTHFMMRNASGLSISAVVAPTSMLVNTTVQNNVGNDDASASLLAPATMPEVSGICIASTVSASKVKAFTAVDAALQPKVLYRYVLNLSQNGYGTPQIKCFVFFMQVGRVSASHILDNRSPHRKHIYKHSMNLSTKHFSTHKGLDKRTTSSPSTNVVKAI
jgi:hypothetical protein